MDFPSKIAHFFTLKAAAHFLPKVSLLDNKAKRGRSLLFAGSGEYFGAGVLAAKAALRAGSGYVILVNESSLEKSWNHPDIILRPLRNDQKKFIFSSVLVGPGYGVNEQTAEIIRQLKKQNIKRVILDADALTVCAQWNLFPLPSSWIMTPHEGELARCLDISSSEVQANREKALQKALEKFKCTVLLKGHGTLVGHKNKIYKIPTGNPALAKSGTGDVLAGIITAFRAQGLGATSAALLGAYVHGAAANLWIAKERDPLSLTASDVIELLPEVLYRIRVSATANAQSSRDV